MKLLVTNSEGRRELLTLVGPCVITESCANGGLSRLTDATGTDYFFEEESGAYDGWARVIPKMPHDQALEVAKSVEAAREFPVDQADGGGA